MRNILIAVAAVWALASSVPAQQAPPATEVYLATLDPSAGVTSWMNISNSPGYDNQPSFLPDNSAILFSSNRDGKQMDIYRYDIAQKSLTQVTNTPEGEYSPLMTPDRRTFSAIRTEADGTQRLWRFNLDGTNPHLVLENVKPVGYHAWIDATHLGLFILGAGGAPATFQIADTTTGTAELAATGIGRSVLRRPVAGTVSYITTGQSRMIKEYDPKSKTSRDLIAPVEASQDAAWSGAGGALFMARGTVIYRTPFEPNGPPAWVPFASLGSETTSGGGPRLSNITRMAISTDSKWIAFVAEPIAK